jgi:hypothetical protein
LPPRRHEEGDKNFRVVAEVAGGETARVLRQAVQPFEAEAAHAGRRAAGGAGAEFQGGTDAEGDAGALRALGNGGGELFLQGRAQSDEGEGCLRGAGEIAGGAEGRLVVA